jgi:hypothetical protein
MSGSSSKACSGHADQYARIVRQERFHDLLGSLAAMRNVITHKTCAQRQKAEKG